MKNLNSISQRMRRRLHKVAQELNVSIKDSSVQTSESLIRVCIQKYQDAKTAEESFSLKDVVSDLQKIIDEFKVFVVTSYHST